MTSQTLAVTFLLALAAAACASSGMISRVQHYRADRNRGDVAAETADLAPGAKVWFEERKGEGDVLDASPGKWGHWDTFFHTTVSMTDWEAHGGEVTATAHEINDFYRFLDWTPRPYTMTWWLDGDGRITGELIKSLPGKPSSRMPEFKDWARQNHPEELGYLLPKGGIDPTGDRPERWVTILTEWRAAAGLPVVQRSAP